MIRKLAITTLILSLMPLVGCGPSDPHEQVMEEMMDCMEEMIEILATITDKTAAEAARLKLQAIGKRMQAIQMRTNEIGAPDQGKIEAMNKKYEARMKELAVKMQNELSRVMTNPEFGRLIAEAMQGAQLN